MTVTHAQSQKSLKLIKWSYFETIKLRGVTPGTKVQFSYSQSHNDNIHSRSQSQGHKFLN